MIELHLHIPLVKGSNRLIYAHPEREDALIKVIPSCGGDVAGGAPVRVLKWKRRPNFRFSHPHTQISREIAEYLRLRSRSADHPECLPKFWGWEDTDIGLGMVVEKMTDSQGNLASTAQSLIQANRFGAEHMAALEKSCRELFAHGVLVSDLNLKNFVYSEDSDGEGRMVLVDGLGDKTFFPLESFSQALVCLGNRRRYRRMLSKLPALESGPSGGGLSRLQLKRWVLTLGR